MNFYKKTTPVGPGWKKIINNHKIEKSKWSVPSGILAMILALIMIYSLLFSTGYIIYGNLQLGISLIIIAISSAYLLGKVWKRIKVDFLFKEKR